MPLNGANTDQMEQRTRRMLRGETAWPTYPVLPMKNRDGKTVRFGTILWPVDTENIKIVLEGPKTESFRSIKAMLEAGWVVD
jgi:hypothetical protein